jgi:hypothetical protein
MTIFYIFIQQSKQAINFSLSSRIFKEFVIKVWLLLEHKVSHNKIINFLVVDMTLLMFTFSIINNFESCIDVEVRLMNDMVFHPSGINEFISNLELNLVIRSKVINDFVTSKIS